LGENWFCVGEYIFPNGDVYYGEFKNHDSFKNGIPHGPGELTIKDGTRFLGLFKNGKLNGVGTEYSSNGVLVKRGLYIEGKFEASVKTLDYEEETNSFHDKAIKEVFANLIYVKDCAGRELEDGQMCWGFRPITVDLNLDGFNEIIVMHTAPGYCGSGGCSSFILQKDLEKDSWFTIGEVWPSYWDNMHVSSKMTDGFFDIIIGEHICTGHPYECIE
jgi:hypothetical protein